ncbi:DUF6421 family protein [Kitasatospora xanthocidica]|uniref:DUF6421 family protein n=1 Tax=Kitasatospora xanthocidica TaxID=83382 RepID=UPI0036E3CAB6
MSTPVHPRPLDPGSITGHPVWTVLKSAVESVRPWHRKDGSIDFSVDGAPSPAELRATVGRMIEAVSGLTALLPHDAAYHRALVADLRRWADDGFGVPDFLDSLLAFDPAGDRQDGREHLVLFPMRSQNARAVMRFEAVVVRLVWPDWLAELERTEFGNPAFVTLALEDYTPEYRGNNAILFAENIAVRTPPERYPWGGVFCDREAARFRVVAAEAVRVLGIDLPAEAARLLADQELAQQTFALWDLIHDRGHNLGPLPYDLFMVKRRAPFWMYALEELRCDLTAFGAAVRLTADAADGPLREVGRRIQYAVLFDRMFRFPSTGGRVRNYDSLAGQLLFAHLRRHGVVQWLDGTLRVAWERVPEVVALLLAQIERLYQDGVDRPRLVHWLAGYDLVAALVPPHPGSRWAKGPDALDLGLPLRELCDEVLPDEFPLGMFHEHLAKRLRDAITASRGLTGRTAATPEPVAGPPGARPTVQAR